MSKESGHYLILDNGAFEKGVPLDIEELWLLGRTYKVSEIVLPDVLYNAHETLQRGFDAIEWIKRNSSNWQYKPKLMFVPQGHNVGEWAYCLYMFIAYFRYKPAVAALVDNEIVIGLAKHTHRFPGGREGLIRDYIAPLIEDFGNFQVHMLGWEDTMWNLKYVAQKYPFVRSIDSAAPYKYALSRRSLVQDQYMMTPLRRQPGYFEAEMNPDQQMLGDHNMEVFRQEAQGRVITNAR